MTSDQEDTVYPDDCHVLDDDDESDSSEDDVLAPEENDEEEDEDLNYPSPSTPSPSPIVVPTTTGITSTAAVTVAVPSASAVTVASIPNGIDSPLTLRTHRVAETAMIVHEDIKHKPPPPQIEDSRRLFQRLWTDEDEIELLQGFQEYTTSNRIGSSHHIDTAVFYELIKSKLQLEFNKNQLVEKLRRLKRKFRTAMSKIDSGKDYPFKTPHDQATFEISRKIWSNTGKIIGVEDNVLDDDETNHNHNNISTVNCNYSISSMNLNNSPHFEMKTEDGAEKKAASKSRKRPRPKSAVKIEDTPVLSDGLNTSNENAGGGGRVNAGNVAGVIEETVRSCLTPVLKEMLNGTKMMMGGMPCGGMGVGPGMGMGLGMGMGPGMGMGIGMRSCNSVVPLSVGGLMGFGFGGSGGEAVVDERWRKQQVLELEVYSKRLELVQDQIKATLEELQSTGGGGGGG